ncbi:zf-HC2 domain-containing protein [Pseudoxanthomonas sacheonensis]|uniref:zf-HC2 domain-containing protein n=1 Tax=Pseudoxanthomonas sacheonensis TaxID=443615 RepID=UPI0013D54CC1|nr:zf-HC2 domain-containing protein [Pseudoxanthomonas sacheonensis]KAF1708046.1 hypothetical protein CSC73_10495 [Pseudoxanthomonas sacheonensis]
MSVDTELLMAYVDGELSPAQAAQVEAAIAADPAVADAVAHQFALRRSLGEAYAPVLDEPVPEALTRMLRPSDAESGNVVALPPRAAPAPRSRWGVPQWAAMAASLLLGVAVSQWISKPDAARLHTGEGGALVAGADLANSLERQLASVPEPDRAVTIGLTFRDAAGNYCRSFAIKGLKPLAGLACRGSDGHWKVPMVAESTAQAGELRQASTAIPAAVLAEATARMSGDPLDAAEERKARDAGWR